MNNAICVDSLPDVTAQQYDLFLASIGYESRSRYVAESRRPNAVQRVACAFAERRLLQFEVNEEWYRANEYDVTETTETDFRLWLNTFLKNSIVRKETFHMLVDISSLSRMRMAHIVSEILTIAKQLPIVVDFTYAIAKYSPPTDPEAIVSAGPVLPPFAGWSPPGLPTIAVLGLGYEPERAVGIYEYLEAGDVWLFIPSSCDSQYDQAIATANATLLKNVPAQQQIKYRVDQPLTALSLLESTVHGMLRLGRAVIVPFGPKIFALAALLVGSINRNAAVWRVSSGQLGVATDREASGTIIGLRVFVNPRPDPSSPLLNSNLTDLHVQGSHSK